MVAPKQNPQIALIIIGDEILSGRTLDKNTQHIAKTCGRVGIDLKEVRVIPDVKQKIIDTIHELEKEFDYIFTTGGIGPTHDDITAESVAAAFGVELIRHPKAYSLLEEYYGTENLNEGRIKMSYVPEGAELIENPVTIAPGFRMGKVYTMAGVPKIMQAMLDAVIDDLDHGVQIISKTLNVSVAESVVATLLSDVQQNYSEVSIGSYPYMSNDYNVKGTNVVFRCQDEGQIDAALAELQAKLDEAGHSHEIMENKET